MAAQTGGIVVTIDDVALRVSAALGAAGGAVHVGGLQRALATHRDAGNGWPSSAPFLYGLEFSVEPA